MPRRELSETFASNLPGVSASLCGTCLAASALVRLDPARSGIATLADNVLAIAALGFLISTILSHLWHRRDKTFLIVTAEVFFAIGCVMLAAVLVFFILDPRAI
jgi:hypothetical protein